MKSCLTSYHLGTCSLGCVPENRKRNFLKPAFSPALPPGSAVTMVWLIGDDKEQNFLRSVLQRRWTSLWLRSQSYKVFTTDPIQYLFSHSHHFYPPWWLQKVGLPYGQAWEFCTKPTSLHTNHYQSQCTLRSCARCGSRNGGPAPCSSPCLLACLSSCTSGQCCSG